MRLGRISLLLFAIYLVFIGGSAYYVNFFAVRVFHHVLITTLLAWWLIRRIQRGDGLPATPLNRPLFASAIVWILSAIFSLDPRMAFENLWLVLIHSVFFFALVELLRRGRQRAVMDTAFFIATLVVFVTGLEVASSLFGLGIGASIGWFDVSASGAPLQMPRAALALNVSTLLAGFVAPLVTLALGWALTTRKRDYRITLWILAALLLIVLIMTDSRGGLLSLFGGMGTLIIFQMAKSVTVRRYIQPRLFLGLAGTAGIIVVAGFLLYTVSRPLRSGDEGRLDMWRSAVEMTRDYPLLGVGPGLYGRALRTYRDPMQARDKLASAHDTPLNTAAETGLAGIAVGIWLAIAFVRGTWPTWNEMPSAPRKLRVETTFAALVGIGIHGLVDVFTITPIVLLIVLLAAYSLVGHRSALDPRPPGQRIPAVIALVLIVGYGLWFIQLDRAQAAFQRSLSGGENALAAAQEAADIDPYLRLYPLQIAHLTGIRAFSGQIDIGEAVAHYEVALELEPTWDTGWINLAALEERRGNIDIAITYLDRARAINPFNSATLHWARLTEGTESDEAVTAAYNLAARPYLTQQDLPLADFWWETLPRQTAVMDYIANTSLEIQYRVLAVHDQNAAADLVPDTPTTAGEWWVVGEYRLSVEGDADAAAEAFSQAIDLNPVRGDYYVSRARATWQSQPDAARLDLDAADYLGTAYEYPNAVRALLAEDTEVRRDALAGALSPRAVIPEFSTVLYGRVAFFDVLPSMRFPGPGDSALASWYALADEFVVEGRDGDAIRVYAAILDIAPYETEAARVLGLLRE